MFLPKGFETQAQRVECILFVYYARNHQETGFSVFHDPEFADVAELLTRYVHISLPLSLLFPKTNCFYGICAYRTDSQRPSKPLGWTKNRFRCPSSLLSASEISALPCNLCAHTFAYAHAFAESVRRSDARSSCSAGGYSIAHTARADSKAYRDA